MGGIVAAGHPLTAEAGAAALRAGGNAVDAAVAAMLTSWAAEPLLTGPGAGGYLLVAGAGHEPTLLDFFVEAPGRGRPPGDAPKLTAVEVSFGDATQVFNAGPAAVGVPGNPAGVCAASARWGTIPLAELAAPAARRAREGVALNEQQAYVTALLRRILESTEEGRGLYAPRGTLLAEGDSFVSEELAGAIELLGAEGSAPFYTGAVAERIVDWLEPRGGLLTREDLAAYEAVARRPVEVAYRGRRVLTNPPPNAGGVLIALALALLDRAPGPPTELEVVEVMERAQAERGPAFVDGLAEEGFADAFLATRIGSTTHISVLDGDGMAASVTCTNGEGSGVVVPGTGVHLNNIMGEEDLNPLGFHAFPPGRRMPSMMAPTVVVGADGVELVVGSAGSNRIRSAILQTIVGVVDHGRAAQAAVDAPRLHFEDGTVFAEPGVDAEALRAAGRRVAPFRARNLFFGGVQAVERDPATGELSGAGDPRRGGVAVAA